MESSVFINILFLGDLRVRRLHFHDSNSVLFYITELNKMIRKLDKRQTKPKTPRPPKIQREPSKLLPPDHAPAWSVHAKTEQTQEDQRYLQF